MRDSGILWKEHLQAGLLDDGWQWDWTTLGTIKKDTRTLRARIVAKSDGIWAAEGLLGALESLSRDVGTPIRVRSAFRDGQVIRPGNVVAEWSGSARGTLGFERPFLNLAAFVSGIATRTRKLVTEVDRVWKSEHTGRSRPPRVTATRKTLPLYRDLAIHGVQAGGGFSHRVSLSGGILIKENHIVAAGGIRSAVVGVRSVAPHGLKLEIEVRNLRELSQALSAGVDGVLLDNFSPAQVRIALGQIHQDQLLNSRPPVIVEVSGGLNEKNIGDYAMTGVDVLSVGSLTHSVQAVDFSLLVK